MQVYAIELVDHVTVTLKRDDNGHPLKFNNGRAIVLALDVRRASQAITQHRIERIEWLGEVDEPRIVSAQGIIEERAIFNPLTEVMGGRLLLDRIQTLLDIESDEHLFLTVAVLDSSQLPLRCSIESYALSSEGDSHASLSDGTKLTGSPVELGSQLRDILEATRRALKKQANLASSFGAGPAKIEEMLKNTSAKPSPYGCGRPECKTCGANPPALVLGLHTPDNRLSLSEEQSHTVVKGLQALFTHMDRPITGVSFIQRQD